MDGECQRSCNGHRYPLTHKREHYKPNTLIGQNVTSIKINKQGTKADGHWQVFSSPEVFCLKLFWEVELCQRDSVGHKTNNTVSLAS